MSAGEPELTDSSDWKSTEAPFMSGIENNLRCHICKEFMSSPVLTSCYHTFCSLCIRSHLNEEDTCPACRTKIQSSSLRQNSVLVDLIGLYKTHRKQLLSLLSHKEQPQNQSEQEATATPPQSDLSAVDAPSDEHRENDNDSETEEVRRSKRKRTEVNYKDNEPSNEDDPVTGCPVCGKRMRASEIQGEHIAQCLDGNSYGEKKPKRGVVTGFVADKNEDMTKKLSAIAYKMYSFSKLQELMRKLGIPYTGSKQQLEQRHRQWITLWNANADSKYPESKSTLLNKLNKWEKNQSISKNAAKTDIKSIDSGEWVSKHQNEFSSLLAQARASAKKSSLNQPNSNTTNEQ
ncbi:hypothetical protein TRICI_005020 [Trichomonascus ciferrii]|uniref:Postreplication repair E3 ubiquitin-protein ligase RAD18 n=1 Tax=Trichomonascus ciferrii TaxID=44093 RepID=A0A642UXI6_9ASCO|nr:hypothetical protein TRICI_005020 [Trichomonascus ciferrii]